ncbi:ribosomal protein S18 acetylase RimI-like enzyme [Paenibacillus taihuensis]|uniref:Ribosomal protein S18 acetylase RimI-like enzyme n=1 Tax=Paenibacillus taihuensis TaxID=1156355 RepID=A0A3D9RNA5_9BACL|nr:GNAT family N-acetyltransferase [Paenibacillus taihuensis]REE81277.1 ribosomal protein S18 acetylase RimI-like enzyme [Paenibacillus taihuensis]
MKLTFPLVHTAEEIAELAAFAAEIWREYYVSIITMEQIDYMIGKFQSIQAMTDQIHHQSYAYYVMQQDGSTVGYMSVKQEDGKLFLSKFYIAKEHRGLGYASQAMTFLEQLCKERQISHIWLTVNRYNESSIAVYEKKGFKVVREQIADIGNGFVMDDYVMGKSVAVSVT